ncbi:hypothetical protein [Massilia sp. ZL223]|uniref:hypothetical protein n=1 Tax=Massilia sp. ZL223 TaxID=2824904 RepID=UPI001B82D07A|nr:hypothetical protein [Massilia sp. ZL223]MBQ5963179.1 hypothetical protein [Massilia sp. ZL223]
MRLTDINRIARSLVRKLTKPLRLAAVAHQMAVSQQNVAHLTCAREEAAQLLAAEHRRQVALMSRRQQIERGFA